MFLWILITLLAIWLCLSLYIYLQRILPKDLKKTLNWSKFASIEEMSDKERFLFGCVAGGCVGDYLGFLCEGDGAQNSSLVAKEIKNSKLSFSASLLRISLSKNNHYFGQVSDDSQLSVALLRSLADKEGRFDAQDYAAKIAVLFKTSVVVGCGLATAKAAAKLNRGVSWEESGSREGEAGNCPATRCALLGCFAFDEDELVKMCVQQSSITHKDKRCAAGSVNNTSLLFLN